MSTEKTFDERLAEAWDEGAKHGTYRMNRGEAVIYDIDNPYRRKPIPEPTEPWALVKFADDDVLYRVPDPTSPSHPWVETGSGEEAPYSWEQAREVFGAPAAVSLPRWSDEVDGLRARVERFADAWETGLTKNRMALQAPANKGQSFHLEFTPGPDDLRALLAEGGEA